MRSVTLPEYPYNNLLPLERPKTLFSKPTGVDLDVTYINRTPMYSRYEVWYTWDGKPYLRPGTENDKRWPAQGEIVSFTAHIINKGTLPSGSFTFKWYVDSLEVHSGTHNSLASGEEATETYQWSWVHSLDGERLLGNHTIRFVADPANTIAETYESNNSLEDRTDALSLVLAVTPELYQALETPIDPQWPYSAEDWLQKQIAAMNAAFVRSIYPSAPNEIVERVRLDKILITSSAPPTDWAEDGGFFMSSDDRFGNAYYDPTTDVSGALLHELTHQLGIIDMYNLDVALEIPQVLDRNGRPIQMEYSTYFLFPGLMNNPGIRPPIYDEHTTLALNANKGYRRGYYGEYLYDVPNQTSLRILDNEGNVAAGVTVKLYQRSSDEGQYGSLHGTIDNTPEITGVTDSNGLILLTNRSVGEPITTNTGHTLRDNPFGLINVVGVNDEFILELTKGTHQEYQWLDITKFNLAYWYGGTTFTIDISSHVYPDNAPASPASLSGDLEYGLVKLRWSSSTSSNIVGYNVYRASRPDYLYQRVVTETAVLNYSEPYDYSATVIAYAVTAVDIQGNESGFSNLFNAFRLSHPAAIVTDGINRIILDPQNGYALYYQLSDGTIVDTRASFDFHLEYSYYMTRDTENQLIIAHPGDYYTSRHSVRVAGEDFKLSMEFGDTGSGPGQFQSPAGVAVWGQPCSSGGPYSVDTHTTLLLHFDGSYNGEQGELGTPNGTTFTQGKYAQGVLIAPDNTLTYATEGNINRTQGAIEFWIKPDWDGGDGQGYTFFEVGNNWFNRIRIMKDGANNLRFMLWDSATEYGVAYNVASWNAGEWHHIAATWEETNIALYVDGQQRSSSNTANPPDTLADTIFIGSSLWNDQQANAVIDEIRISDISRIGNSDTCSYRILVADSGNNRIQAFDVDGNVVSAFGTLGSGNGQFNNPQGLAVDNAGRVIVVDTGNNRLQVLNFDGANFTFDKTFTGNLNGPTGVATFGSDRIIVADTGNNKIKVFDGQGNFLAEYTSPNDGHTGNFDQPRGVTIDYNGSIVVADTGNGRVVTILNAVPVWKIFLPLTTRSP